MPALTRSLAPLLRTGRYALRQQKGVNPVQQVFALDRNGIRGLATVFERTKPHVNIGMQLHFYSPNERLTVPGTIGHVDHGKVCTPFPFSITKLLRASSLSRLL